MSVPTSYTEATLMEYMHDRLGDLADILGWAVEAGNYDDAVVAVLLDYGVTDIVQATDIRKLRALAARAAWRQAMDAVSHLYDVDADGARRSRSQLVTHVGQALARAEALCWPYEDQWVVEPGELETDGGEELWTMGGQA